MKLLISLLAATLLFSSCASRQVIEENKLQERIMDTSVELNGEFTGKPYDPQGEISLWAQTRPSSMGSSGMVFHYIFENDMKLTIDGKVHTLTSTKAQNIDVIRFQNVPASLLKQIANAQKVTVSLVAEQGRVKYESEFTDKNFFKIQEFVQKYIDANQKVRSLSMFSL